ncbi:hypothetical protein PILCRDRAFT_624329 [Piloderma croceum F 1598]|uniref:Uncharacterized protein n=1 Tax=Piloderma croceum (strain F 1598) TaxID=765440 RepID=A0A0C3FBG0_PILCF|nr:hypothetical protein PILCRDRAFT_624329 [Piloderma croceum F 1598]
MIQMFCGRESCTAYMSIAWFSRGSWIMNSPSWVASGMSKGTLRNQRSSTLSLSWIIFYMTSLTVSIFASLFPDRLFSHYWMFYIARKSITCWLRSSPNSYFYSDLSS